MKHEIGTRPWRRSPFDDSAAERVRRMGLVFEDGSPDRDAMAVLSCVFAGQFYDDLCDFRQDMQGVWESVRQFVAEAARASPQRRFVLICLQYDAIYRTLPDPVWWISGNAELADLFSAGFIARLEQFTEEGA